MSPGEAVPGEERGRGWQVLPAGVRLAMILHLDKPQKNPAGQAPGAPPAGQGGPQPRTACCTATQAEGGVRDCPGVLAGSPLMRVVVPPHKYTLLPQTQPSHTYDTHPSYRHTAYTCITNITCAHSFITHLHTSLWVHSPPQNEEPPLQANLYLVTDRETETHINMLSGLFPKCA